MPVLSEEEIDEKLSLLDGWNFSDNHIRKEYEFSNFSEALKFVNKVGEAAEDLNHHPDIFMHSWNKVKISVTTHSEGGVTEKDFVLAHLIERAANE